MKKETALILTRDDLQDGYEDLLFKEVNPFHFGDKIVRKMEKYSVVLFINSSGNQEKIDKRTRVIMNKWGYYGEVVPLIHPRKQTGNG